MTQDLKTIDKESKEMIAEANKFEVANQLNYDEAANKLKNWDLFKKKVELFFKPTIDKFKLAKKAAEDGRKEETKRMEEHTAPVLKAIEIIRGKCKEYENEQEKKRLKDQEEERKRAEKEAKEKKARLEKQAETAKAWDDEEEVEELQKEAEEVEVEEKKVAPTIAKTTGLGIRRAWKWKLVNEHDVPREFLKINEVAINSYVREKKDKGSIEGIEIYFD